MTFVEVTVKPDQAQFLQGRDFSIDQVVKLIEIPATLLSQIQFIATNTKGR